MMRPGVPGWNGKKNDPEWATQIRSAITRTIHWNMSRGRNGLPLQPFIVLAVTVARSMPVVVQRYSPASGNP